MTLAEVDAFATSFPGVTVGTKWGNRTRLIGDSGFAAGGRHRRDPRCSAR